MKLDDNVNQYAVKFKLGKRKVFRAAVNAKQVKIYNKLLAALEGRKAPKISNLSTFLQPYIRPMEVEREFLDAFQVIIQAVEMLKAIEIEFKTKKFLINKWVILINRYTCEFIMRQIERGMQKVYAMKEKQRNIQNNMMELMMNVIECYKGGYN